MVDQSSHLSAQGQNGFVLEVVKAQSQLYAYILSLVLDHDRASDILQQTNTVLLEKQADFKPGTSFGAWASRVAYYEVLSDRRNRSRDKHLFSDELLAIIASRAEQNMQEVDKRLVALRHCLQELSNHQRDLVLARYGPGGSVGELAKRLNKTPNAISAMLFRARNNLQECISKRLKGLTAL